LVQITPILVINFKNYLEVSGAKALGLARAAENVSTDLNVNIALVPPIPSIATISDGVSLPVFSQHVDSAKIGGSTGSIVPEVCKEAGAVGTLINHSEMRVSEDLIREVIPRIRGLGMQSIVCAATPDEVSKFAPLTPDFIAIEPPELIGSGTAVSKARPEVITDSVKAAAQHPSVSILCGAGIVTGEDVTSAMNLGAKGILVASGIVKASNWEDKVRELAQPLVR